MADSKLGVYICTDCGIGEAINVEELQKTARGAAQCRAHPFLCSDAGVQVIKDDINNEGINKIVIAACSPRVNTDVFDFDPLLYFTERVNIREHVVWTQPAGAPGTQLLAIDNLSMGIAKASRAEPPVPRTTEVHRSVLVIGGGVTGLTAAIESAKAGFEAVIVEESAELGGFAKKSFKGYPVKAPFDKLSEPTIGAKIKAAENDPKIKIHLGTKVTSIEGEPGTFEVSVDKSGKADKFTVGAVILATGWRPYDATVLVQYGYGRYKNVITNVEMEGRASSGKITRPSDGKTANSVLFVQCAGQRDTNNIPYCSSVCCNVSLKQAKYVRESNPDSSAYIIYKDMRTMGQYEGFYKAAQDDAGIFLAKGEVRGLEETADGSIMVDVYNQLLSRDMKIKVDLVVLATGMVSNMLPEGRAVNSVTPEYVGDFVTKVTQDGSITELMPASIVLNLKYRQGPELPHLKYGFPDSHFICFPYETRRTGIYAAGAVRHPMDSQQSSTDAAGAALKAIQCIELTAKGMAVHPRSGDMTFPEFRLENCTQCRRCTVECPFGVLDEDEKGTPKEHPARCRRCGTCMGACPQRIISFKNYSVDIVSSMLKAVDVPSEGDEPFIIAFICENDAYPALDMAGLNRVSLNPNFRFIPLRCLGGTNLVWIADALSKGVDGVMLIGCKYGDNYQCHFIKGSQIASERLSKVQETLGRLMLEAERVQQVQLSIDEWELLPKLMNDFSEQLKGFGPNPYKGF